ncbi:hypothetical protein LELG_04931 [Lodderomyces elongisporus NRRL YB-4239]|uniref:Uncharacterized protein n=1 Tax=Lodderomyces elongisporus (strain ATCC 11503 / CBS 2605 / JCM 1781 / NBRC 1676 / NRRL YB-4239) TaxID=379508 RepID=A5E5P2_LODEL|nr:hypothetical protein LELG_04931 [Lodderomyces elongisporus NRRL YB-4239]
MLKNYIAYSKDVLELYYFQLIELMGKNTLHDSRDFGNAERTSGCETEDTGGGKHLVHYVQETEEIHRNKSTTESGAQNIVNSSGDEIDCSDSDFHFGESDNENGDGDDNDDDLYGSDLVEDELGDEGGEACDDCDVELDNAGNEQYMSVKGGANGKRVVACDHKVNPSKAVQLVPSSANGSRLLSQPSPRFKRKHSDD